MWGLGVVGVRMATRSKLAIVVHADVVGSTALVQEDERVAHERIRNAFQHFSTTIETYGGKAHEIRGDALVAQFERASDAVSAAMSFQLANQELNQQLAGGIRPEVRIGIALGEVVIADGTITGAGIVLAQRLEQHAEPNGLCISAAVREALPPRLPFRYGSLGEQKVKGFDEPVRVFTVTLGESDQVPAAEDEASTLSTLTRPRGDNRRPRAALIALLMLLVGGSSILWFKPWSSDSQRGDSADRPADIAKIDFRPALIVLPFSNFGGDPEQEYFSDGFTEDLTTALARIPGFLVTARNTAFTFKGQSVDAGFLGQQLQVRYVLEESIRKRRDSVRINAQLIETASGNHVWAETYDRPLADILAIQDELVDRIVGSVASHLRRKESERAFSASPDQLAVYDLSIKARFLFKRNELSTALEARELLRTAIEIDPSYALAYSLLGEVENYFFTHRVTNEYASEKTSARMVQAASRAIALAPDNAYAHAVHGIAFRTLNQYKMADAEAQRAYALAPKRPGSSVRGCLDKVECRRLRGDHRNHTQSMGA